MDLAPFPGLRAQKEIAVGLWSKADADSSEQAIARALGVPHAASLWQIHGARAVVVREPTQRTIQADALATDVPGLALAIRIADCQPILVHAPDARVVALIHAGWKGLVEGTIASCFAMLRSAWGIAGQDTFVAVGPSLCKACAEFTDPVRELPGIDPQFFDGRLVDLPGIADAQLCSEGVRPERLERHFDCTRCHPETYWTYRGGDRDAVKAGSGNAVGCVMK